MLSEDTAAEVSGWLDAGHRRLRWPERSGLILRRSGGYSLPRAPTPRRARLARLRPRLGCG
jgi:hypothetical protein